MRLARAHKYGAKRCEMDGYKFASQAEMRRYQELKLMEKGGFIRDLRLQVPFPLYAYREGFSIMVAKYIADFTYEEFLGGRKHPRKDSSWRLIVEDTKGFRTPLYRLKAKWMSACYGLEIRETS